MRFQVSYRSGRREDRQHRGHQGLDALTDKSASNPITILTNKIPVNGMEPNRYYTVYSKNVDNIHITVWNSTILEPSGYALFQVTLEELRRCIRYLYHLRDWAHL
ncbi:uncharacterized protein L203_103986 [Cryptococcus depauperatus CBS 7841]|uniref:Uncharacterized protein n=1 Tax=Cryptococcus depauperatus CBS 7841 TaxID=1295531 RepID=A0AAJ8JUK9_9TREE